jgi:hypothetical protein
MKNLEAAFELFDVYNKQDPRLLVWDNISYPQEYFFAIKLYEWVLKLDAAASEELLLASRSQHIGRWEIPRESYPDGRDAYLEWRKNLALHHAGIASKLMAEAGFSNEQVERVRQIILKKRIKVDPDVQTMENALCLVFLQYQYEEFWKKHEQKQEKLVNILRRSLLKMDSHGHSFALELPYSDDGLQFIKEALNQM